MKKTVWAFCLMGFLCSCDDGDHVATDLLGEDATPDSVILLPKEALTDTALEVQTVTFPSLDSLPITADIYQKGNQPWIVLAHQAGYSRGEYKETAPIFVDWGYNCMAIDQRSGGKVNAVPNETALAAGNRNLPQNYIDAEQDMRAAVDYAFKKENEPIILVGSSYSASLALKIANGNPKVKGVMVFSPGEYYENESVHTWADGLTVPVFVTSSKTEAEAAGTTAHVGNINVTHFIPDLEGAHGSSGLWSDNAAHPSYRKAVKSWLDKMHR